MSKGTLSWAGAHVMKHIAIYYTLCTFSWIDIQIEKFQPETEMILSEKRRKGILYVRFTDSVWYNTMCARQ